MFIIYRFLDKSSGFIIPLAKIQKTSSKMLIDKWNNISEFSGFSSFCADLVSEDGRVINDKSISFEDIEADTQCVISDLIMTSRVKFIRKKFDS